MFFSFEGLDGAGKSTQMQRFCAWLTQQGHEVVTCRDPGSTELGEALRRLLLERSSMQINRRSEMLMYMAARAQLVEEVIRPALAAHKFVVCDRYLLANIVYQGHAGGLDPAEIRAVGQVATAKIMPDITFVFNVPVEVALARMNRTLDRMESQGTDYLQRVREGFLTEAPVYPARVEVIDATCTVEQIFAELCRLAAPLLPTVR